MKLSNITCALAAALIALPVAQAEQKDKKLSYQLTDNMRAELGMQVHVLTDLRELDDAGDNTSLYDSGFSGRLIYNDRFEAFLQTEVNERIKDIEGDTFNADNFVKNANIKVGLDQQGDLLIAVIGRQSVAFGRDITQSAINEKSLDHKAIEKNDRKMAVLVSIKPELIGTTALSEYIQEINLTAYKADSSSELDMGDLGGVDSYAAQVKGVIAGLGVQVSLKNEENAWGGSDRSYSASAEMPLDAIGHGATVYGQYIKDRSEIMAGVDSDRDTFTVGAGVNGPWRTRANMEYSNVSSDVEAEEEQQVGFTVEKAINKTMKVALGVYVDPDAEDADELEETAQVVGQFSVRLD